jgi:hypothetical protein
MSNWEKPKLSQQGLPQRHFVHNDPNLKYIATEMTYHVAYVKIHIVPVLNCCAKASHRPYKLFSEFGNKSRFVSQLIHQAAVN